MTRLPVSDQFVCAGELILPEGRTLDDVCVFIDTTFDVPRLMVRLTEFEGIGEGDGE